MFPHRVKYDEVAKKKVVLTCHIAVYQSVEKSGQHGVCEGINWETDENEGLNQCFKWIFCVFLLPKQTSDDMKNSNKIVGIVASGWMLSFPLDFFKNSSIISVTNTVIR